MVRSERLDDAPLGEGTEFRLVASFLHRETTLIFRIVEYDPPNAVTFRGENSTIASLDRITFEPYDGGTRIVYDADLTLKGPLRLADPLLALAFNRVGDSALQGMRETLGAKQPDTLPALSGRSLDGEPRELPDDLSKSRTFIIAAFRREQQAFVDQWLPWLLELEERRPDLAVYERPVLSTAYSPARWFIDGGMARGVGSASARARTSPSIQASAEPCEVSGCQARTPSPCCLSSVQGASSPASSAALTSRRRSSSPRRSSAARRSPRPGLPRDQGAASSSSPISVPTRRAISSRIARTSPRDLPLGSGRSQSM
jgi:hypothetical protein